VSDDPVLVATSLSVRYRSTTAVDDVSLQVNRGEVVGLIGPDGAGKTSTLRVLAGLLRASCGSANAFGEDCWRQRRDLHHRLGYLAQRFALYGDLTVNENVQFFALLNGVPGWRQRRAELLELVGLDRFGDRLAERLSGGMKQKLALACTLIHSPEILLLDEPTTGVDPVTRRELWRLLAQLISRGLTLVVATPYLDEAERCTRVVLMHDAHVLADLPPARIPELMPGVVVEVTASSRRAAETALRQAPNVLDVAVFGTTLHVHYDDGADAVPMIEQTLAAAGVSATRVRRVRTGLEDAFLYLTRTAPQGTDAEVA